MTISGDASEVSAEGAHVTLGRHFRTPAHPEALLALGRAQYTFLSLEESVTAILYEAGVATLPEARGKMAAQKEKMLAKLADQYRRHPSGVATADLLGEAVQGFKVARELVRNKLSHAHPFTAGKDDAGNYLPGLAFTVRDGSSWETLSTTPGDLLDLATEVEKAISPLGAARRAVRDLPLSSLTD